MKFIYLTAKTFPGSTADHAYICALATAFARVLSDSFLLVGNRFEDPAFHVPHIALDVPVRFKRSFFYFLWFPRYVRREKLNRLDVVFFSNDQYLLRIALWWRRVFSYRYVVVADWHMLSRTTLDRAVARQVDLSITTSVKLARAVEELGGKRVVPIYGGVDLVPFSGQDILTLRQKLDLPGHITLVAYTGLFKTLGLSKGIETMIAALLHLPESVSMLFVGGKREEIEEYQRLADTIGASDRCIFRERVSFAELAEYEGAADVLAIPYPDKPHFRDFGFPMKVYEYMAAARPVVYTKLDLVEEVIGTTGYPCRPDSPEDFARAVRDILLHKESARARAQEAREHVVHLDWSAKAQAILEEIQKVS